MARKVIISIDVEAQKVRAPERHIERLVYGRITPETPPYGINRMFDIADKYGIQLTCFFDYGEIPLYGEKWLNVGRYIQSRRHDLELHLHPDFIPQELWPEGMSRELNMFNLDVERANFLADYICQAHRSLTGEDAVAFRGGGYRYNGFLLQALARNGVKFDSSYNASRANQAFNQGALPPFQWDCGLTEIPVPCMPGFRGSSGLVEFNFNNYDFQNHFPRVCVQYMRDYLEEYFRQFPEGIPVLVMHSWSFLKLNNESGYFDETSPRAPEIFDGFCKMLAENYEPVSFAQLGAQSWQPKLYRQYEPNIFSVPVAGNESAYKCPVCGAGEDCNIERRLCGKCGAVERTRALARLLLENGGQIELAGRKILHLGGKGSEGRILDAISGLEITNLDIRPEVKPDVVADICHMPQVAGKSFDVIIAGQFLSHVHDLPAALGELSRVLKDDGILIQNDDSRPNALTSEVSDPEIITAYWGKEIFEKYKIGRFRAFGEYDLDEIFAPWFERKKYSIVDPATGKTEIWNCWRKTDICKQLAQENISFAISRTEGNVDKGVLAEADFLFFENQIVEPGKKATLYGLLTQDEIAEVPITDYKGETVASLRINGSLSPYARKCLQGNTTVEFGVPASLGTVEIPTWLKPGIYFLDGRWTFFVSAPLQDAKALVALPIATMQMFSDFGGQSRHAHDIRRSIESGCSLKRPVSRRVIERDICIRADFFAWLCDRLQGQISFAADHDLPGLEAASIPGLIIVPGRSEYWSKEAEDAVRTLQESGKKFIFAASEIMYCKLRHSGDRISLDKKDRIRDGGIRSLVGCNCFDGGFITSDMYANDIGYGDFTILEQDCALFRGTGLKSGDILTMRTAGYEGLPVASYGEDGRPALDRDQLQAWQRVDLAAFSMGQKGPAKKIGALAYFNSGKGAVLNLGGMTWVYSDIFSEAKSHPALKIWENALDFCLSDSAQPFMGMVKETAGDLPEEKILSLTTCPVCGNELKEFENKQNCPGCASRARVRSLYPLLEEVLLPWREENPLPDLPMLGFAMSGMEIKAMAPWETNIRHSSLFGKYAPDADIDVDARHMPCYADESFSCIYSCLLFDYFAEHEQALAECFRVLAPGGIFLTHIAPYRLKPGNEPPCIKSSIKGRTDYFGYLPKDSELPSIEVGQEWFRKAMEKEGFGVRIIEVDDPSGVRSAWFLGFKNGGNNGIALAEARPKEKNVQFPIKTSKILQMPISLDRRRTCALHVELLEGAVGSLYFLEDHIQTNGKRELIATNGGADSILVSKDDGNTFEAICANIPWDSKIRQIFTLEDGDHLVRTLANTLYHISSDGELLAAHKNAGKPWHGSQGIGQSESGIVLFAEYHTQIEESVPVSVWRYDPKNPKKAPVPILTLEGRRSPPGGEVRHFHVCNPISQNRWLLASGDKNEHCRLWISDDDGAEWQEIRLADIQVCNMPEAHPQPWRFTSFIQLPDGDIFWGCDDTSASKQSAAYRLHFGNSGPELTFLDFLAPDSIRSCITIDAKNYLLISESLHYTQAAHAMIYNIAAGILHRVPLPNFSEKVSSFTVSRGSRAFINNRAFLPCMGSIMVSPDTRGIFRITLGESDVQV